MMQEICRIYDAEVRLMTVVNKKQRKRWSRAKRWEGTVSNEDVKKRGGIQN